MSTIYVPVSAATPEFLASVPEHLDVHLLPEGAPAPTPSVEPTPKSAPSVQEAPVNPFGIYAQGHISDRPKFLGLHPVITRGKSGLHGSIELRAKLNTLPVVGEWPLSDTAWSALGKVMHENDLQSKDVRKNGDKAASVRFYAPRIKANGKPTGIATQLLRDGCRIRLDCTNHTVKLVCGNGRAPSFGKGIVAPLTRALEGMDQFALDHME